jgi:ATP:ADP antiporter, AAA family
MQFSFKSMFKSLWEVEPEEKLKTFFLGVMFFLIIFSYTLTKELKDSVFLGIIGTKDYVPWAKFLTLFALIPLVFFYSKLVDTIRRYQLLCLCATIYAVIGLLCAYLVGHSSIGLPNEVTGTNRVFGWVFYFFVESFTPFVLSVFWAFLNSVSSPKSAKSNYGLLIAASKLGGMASAGLGWTILYNAYWFRNMGFSDTGMIQFLLVVSSFALLMVPVATLWMMKKVPGHQLHGYEAAYQFEKKQSKTGKESTGMFSGLLFLLKNPYTFGIFLSVLFYEMISSVLSFQRLGVAQEVGCGIAGTSCFLLGLSFSVHCVGFFISTFGTRVMVSKLGERLSLLLMPISMGTLLFYYMYSTSPYAILISFVAIRAIYYAFNQPVMEALYIPTVKAVKFKSKSWIDTFGKKMSKGAGSLFNGAAAYMGPAWSVVLHTGFFGLLVVAWTVVAYFLGQRYHRAIKYQEVIGSEEYE